VLAERLDERLQVVLSLLCAAAFGVALSAVVAGLGAKSGDVRLVIDLVVVVPGALLLAGGCSARAAVVGRICTSSSARLVLSLLALLLVLLLLSLLVLLLLLFDEVVGHSEVLLGLFDGCPTCGRE
jgi:hypothetical protein